MHLVITQIWKKYFHAMAPKYFYHGMILQKNGHFPIVSFVKLSLYCLFVLLLNIPVNSYGHGEMVSSPNHTFSWASLNKRLTMQ